jgi:hypothetical protein
VDRLAPPVVLLLVTLLLFGYGSHAWSWLAGPVAGLVVWGLGRETQRPVTQRAPREPAPVD